MPTRPDWFEPIVAKFTRNKLPAFFEYAKDKEKNQIEERNDSFVNKLYKKIPDNPINTRSLKLENLEYQKLMHNTNIICSREVSDLYDQLNKEYRYKINMKDEYIDNLHFIGQSIRNEFSALGYSEETITDMLVQYLYGGNKRAKQLLWFCYGNIIVGNIEKNIGIKKTKFVQCVDCGEWIEVNIKDTKTCRCEVCKMIHNKKIKSEQNKRSFRRKKIQ